MQGSWVCIMMIVVDPAAARKCACGKRLSAALNEEQFRDCLKGHRTRYRGVIE